MKEVKWGIIGCGDVTEKKSGPAFGKVPYSKLVAVMRRDVDKAASYAQRHNVERWYGDASALLNDTEVNAVYIATPPSSHAAYAIAAMRAGKAVYVEKPMARTYAECLAMIAASEETGMPLFVAYYRRTLPGFLKVKELIDNGVIGDPLVVNIRLCRPATQSEQANQSWRVDPTISGGGIFHDLASHQLDYLDFLFGPIVEASGSVMNNGGFYAAEDTVVASFKHESGVLGSGIWSFVTNDDGQKDSVEIIGRKGRLVFSSFGHTPLHLFKDGKEELIEYEVPESVQYHLISQVVDELRGYGKCVSTGYSAARTSLIMDQIIGTVEY